MLKKQYLKSKPICKVTFVLPKTVAEHANEVRVLGEFNNWNWEEGLVMKATKTEYKATIELETGRNYEFRYVADGDHWFNDDQADAYVPSPFGEVHNCIANVKVQPVEEQAAPAKKTTTKKTTTKKTTAKKTTTKKTAAKSDKDNLKKIEGIGPKIEKLLQEKGIMTYKDLSKAKITVLKEILEEAGSRYRMHDPSTWAEQAKLADKGDWEKLDKLQDELKGGKR